MSKRVLVRAVAAVVLVAIASAAAISWRTGDDAGSYRMTAYFDSAVALYPHSHVTVMGARIGTVDAVEIEDTRVRVEMTIRDSVPLPENVNATIEPLQLIGERNIVLYPPWNANMAADGIAQARDGDVIPQERTVTPVEPDEGLAAFNELAESLEPDVVASIITDSAKVLDGRGADIGESLGRLASISDTFAGVDEQLVAAAESIHVLTSSLDEREEQITTLIEGFADATEVLASERDAISAFIESLVRLTDEGSALIEAYGGQIPQDLANLAAFALVVNDNVSAVEELFASFPLITEGLAEAYDPDAGGLALKGSLTPTTTALLASLTDFLERALPGAGS